MGMRVEPPTSRTRSISGQLSPACLSNSDEVVSVRSNRSRVMSSNSVRPTSIRIRTPAWNTGTVVFARSDSVCLASCASSQS